MVQFFQAFLEAIIIFGINAVLGALLLLALRSYLRDRIEQWLFSSLSEYIQNQLALTLKNPNETAKLLKPLLVAIIQEVMKDFQGSQKEGMVKIPFLGKVPPQLIQAFLDRFLGGSSKKNNEGSNPFA